MTCYQYPEFRQQMTELLSKTKAIDNPTMSMIFIQFEGITELDSLLGFQAVDRLLEEAAQRLLEALMPTDLVGYLDRHHLVCFLPKLTAPSYAELAGYKILRILAQPFFHDDRQYILTPRLGMTISRSAADGVEEMLRQANSALLSNWHAGTPINMYSNELNKDKMLELDLISDLQLAIEESRLSLVYQPQVDLKTNKIMGAEALLRWDHPNRGPILTDMMIRVAERTNLITKLTYWVLHTALHHLKDIHTVGVNLHMSVNISAHNLREHDLLDIASEALRVWGIQAEYLTIEITETAVMENLALVLDTLSRLKEMGIRIALDDFGTGYSSLAVLGKLPINEVKIDLSLVRNMLKKVEHERIVASIIALSHSLDMEVIAEGVEDQETFDRLEKMGCNLIQGYLVSPPLPLPEFIALVKKYNGIKSTN